MKNFRFMLFLAALAGLTTFAACNHSHQHTGTDETTETTPADQQGKEYTSAYICPMYCTGSGSEEPGKCPVCGMDYVANPKNQQHEDHEGHGH